MPPPEDDAPLDDWAITDVTEFQTYGSIIGCAVVPAIAVTALAISILRYFDAPRWIDAAIAILFVTMPYAVLARWVWHKPALRLPSGRIVRQRDARRATLLLCIAACAVLAGNMLLA